MAHPLTPVEIAIRHVNEAEARVAEQRERIALLKESGRPAEMSENLLRPALPAVS